MGTLHVVWGLITVQLKPKNKSDKIIISIKHISKKYTITQNTQNMQHKICNKSHKTCNTKTWNTKYAINHHYLSKIQNNRQIYVNKEIFVKQIM